MGEIYKYLENVQDENERLNKVNYFVVCILITALWYIATSRSTKYIYNKTYVSKPSKKGDKRVINVKPIKTISTPIYDIGKVKYITLDKLITRRKGWTYSHAFQVHGHYRHYKNGKTIFINSYIKGKGKELQAQKTILEPEENNG